jgi:hypothetical protein
MNRYQATEHLQRKNLEKNSIKPFTPRQYKTIMNAAIACEKTHKKKSGCWPVKSPKVFVINSGIKIKSAMMPQANPNVMSRNGSKDTMGVRYWSRGLNITDIHLKKPPECVERG